MATPQFNPNEVVGYRIKPDYYSFNVVLVKRHGATSAQAGLEYETPLAYCKDLPSAVQWMHNHIARARGESLESELPQHADSLERAKALLQAFEDSRTEVLKAVAELTQRLEAAGLSKPQEVARLLKQEEWDTAAAAD